MQAAHVQPSCSGRCHAAPAKAAFASKPCLNASVHMRQTQVGAINKARKAEVVADLTEKLNASSLVYGLRYKGVPVKTVEAFRRNLPEGAVMYVTKNRLLRVAVDNMDEAGQAKWAGLRGQKGDNAWVFADEDSIQGASKAYGKYLKELLDEQPVPKKGQPEPPAPTAVTAIVLDGALLEKNQFKQLEKMPTKAQTVTMIARAIKAVPTKVAVGVKAVPTKLARAINCLAELNDDKTMTVEAAAAAKASE